MIVIAARKHSKHSVKMATDIPVGIELALYDSVSALMSRELVCRNTVDELWEYTGRSSCTITTRINDWYEQ